MSDLQMLTGGGGLLLRRRMMMQNIGSSWPNPYVTQGLIAMWDGEWNAGWNNHTSEPSQMVNYATQRLANVSIGENGEVGENYISTIADDNVIINLSDVNLFGVTDATIEIVLAVSQFRTQDLGAFFAVTNKLDLYATLAAPPHFMYHRGSSAAKDTKQTILADGVMRTCTLIANTSFVKFFINGQQKASETLNRAIGFVNGNYPSFRLAGFGGKLYCARVYNRVLTDEEVAANAAVDSSRFSDV